MSTEITATVLPEVQMTDELAKAIQEAVSASDVRALLIAEAEKQVAAKAQLDADQATATQAAADKAAADAAAAAAVVKTVKRVENIGGQNLEFEGADDAEVDRLILNAYKVAFAVRSQEPAPVEVVPDATAVAAAAEAEIAAKAELERKFRLNEISAAEYIQKSGAIKSYLEAEGVSIEALKETVNANRNVKFEQSWKQAGEQFVKTAAGADWPGGDKNQELLGLKIAALNLVDAEDKVAALAQAYADLKKTGMLFPAEVAVAAPAAAAVVKTTVVDLAAEAAKTAEATRAAAAAKVRSMSSSLFGQSSGTSGAPITSPEVVAAAKVIPDNATPAEILQAWKESQLAAGKDPNAEFLAAHRGSAR